MMREAEDRLTDAAHLATRSDDTSDSAYLLELLAFELLLKAAVLLDGHTPGKEHNYRKLFHLLDSAARQSMILAAGRVADGADFTNVDGLLDTWSSNFVTLRYPFEKYAGMTEKEYLQRGEQWLARGATLQTADFVYHPAELLGFVSALDAHLQARLPPSR